ncbi:hypothetical protein ANTRET_LOCUS4903 [Anthophora retusa]
MAASSKECTFCFAVINFTLLGDLHVKYSLPRIVWYMLKLNEISIRYSSCQNLYWIVTHYNSFLYLHAAISLVII